MGSGPGTVHSDDVVLCEIDASKVTLTLGAKGSTSFHVVVVGMDGVVATAAQTFVTGKVNSFTTEV